MLALPPDEAQSGADFTVEVRRQVLHLAGPVRVLATSAAPPLNLLVIAAAVVDFGIVVVLVVVVVTSGLSFSGVVRFHGSNANTRNYLKPQTGPKDHMHMVNSHVNAVKSHDST